MKNLYGKWIIILLFLIPVMSCSFSSKKMSGQTATKSIPVFKVPEVPLALNPEQKIDFMLAHYWDNFDFKDTTCINRPTVSEQAFVDFCHLLLSVPTEKATAGISVLMQKASTCHQMLQYFLTLGEKYLYDPNSPVRHEVLYCKMVEPFLASPLIEDAWKIRPQSQFDLAQKNKVGEQATNFNFTLKNGSTSSLYAVKSNYLLLYFHNPGCTECKIEREKIIASNLMQEMQKKGFLKVVSLYPDKDLSEWEKYYTELPGTWINGYDKQGKLKDQEVYDLKAIPTFYLLNDQKVVLLKDARFEEIEVYLSKL